MKIFQSKLEVHDTFKKDEKITINSEAVNDEDVIKQTFLRWKIPKNGGLLSLLEKGYNELKLRYNKQSVEEISIQRVVKTTMQLFYAKWLLDNFPNAVKVLKNFLFDTSCRGSKWR